MRTTRAAADPLIAALGRRG